MVDTLENNNIIITGTQINYFFVCKRKLWFFSRQIIMERNSHLIEIGTTIHQMFYSRKQKEIALNGIKIDFFEKNKMVIHEVKKSETLEIAHIWQLKYYIYRFKQLGIEVSGILNYPISRKTKEISFDEQDNVELQSILKKIKELIRSPTPPTVINAKFCKKCSYYELCYA